MANIKKLNELFDDETFKSEYEIPYLKGEIHNDLKWKKMKFADEKSSESLVKKVIFKFPILDEFNIKSLDGDNSRGYAFFHRSNEPVDGTEYYTQIAYTFLDNFYHVFIILKEVEETNENNWTKRFLSFDNIEDVYKITDIFLDVCIKMNVIHPEQKKSVISN